MAKIDTSKMRPGTRVELDGEPFTIIQYQHVKPLDRTLKSGEALEAAEVSHRQMQYLYPDGDRLVFMDRESYEQTEIPRDRIENVDLMSESCEVDVLLHRGKPVGIELPTFVVLEVTETDPPEKGGKLKPARFETGAVIQVPSFIDRGEKLKIDTRDRSYVERS
jgi:elongation factor P